MKSPKKFCKKVKFSNCDFYNNFRTVKPLKKRPKIGFSDQLSLNAGQKYCRMLHWEHSAILSTFLKLPYVIRFLFCLFLSGRLRQVLLFLMVFKPRTEGR